MALSKEQIVSLIKEPKAKAQLIKALKHEQRVKFHAEESTDESDCSPYLKDFLQWVSQFLPADKFEMFKKLLGFPLYTNELIKGISKEFAKVYDSQNSSFTYEFSNETLEAEFKSFLRNEDFWNKWKDKSGDAMLTAINSILIVDMPKELSLTPKPYYYFQDISGVTDIGIDEEGRIIYLIVDQGDDKYLAIDDEKYVVYQRLSRDQYNQVHLAPHGLGYCPATFFWKKPVKTFIAI